MKKSDLRSGDIVKTREGDKYIVLLNTKYYRSNNLLINLKEGGFLILEDYNYDLLHDYSSDFDIIAVCSKDYVGDNLKEYGLTGGYTNNENWTWERKKVKEEDITKETIEKLGNLYKEDEQKVTLVAGKINATGKILCWKSDIFFPSIGDYAIVENKFFVTVASIIIALFVGLLIYFNVGIYTMKVNERTPFVASGVGMIVKSAYVTNKDYKLNELNNDKALVVLRIEVKANNQNTEKLNTGLANLRIKNYSFGPTTKYINTVKDLGNIYFDQKLDGDYKSYILVYEIPKGLMKESMQLKFNDTVSFVRGEVGAKSIYVKLKPINLDKIKENKTQKIGETLNLKDSILGQTTLKINSYQIAEKFKISYNYCYTASKCVNSVEYVNPTASSNYNKVIMKIEGTFKKDSSVNISKMNDLFDFINSFGILTYVVDGKTYTHPTTLRRVTPQKAKLEDTYYIEVVPEVAKATSIYFDFKVRNEEYKYILK